MAEDGSFGSVGPQTLLLTRALCDGPVHFFFGASLLLVLSKKKSVRVSSTG